MIRVLRVGQLVRVHYRAGLRETMPLHGKTGTIAIIDRGPGLRNHGVLIAGQLHDIPASNLMPLGKDES